MIKQSSMKSMSLSTLTKVSVFAGVAFVLTLLNVNLSIFPSFLDLELSDVPQVIALLSWGTLPAVFVLLIKNLLMLFKTSSAGIGELANFVIGLAYLIPFGFIYNKMKNNKGFILASIFGTISMTIVASIFNYYVLIPAYTSVLNYPLEAILAMAQKVNSKVTDLKLLIIYSIAPFNILKAVIFSICSFLVYKALKPALKFFK